MFGLGEMATAGVVGVILFFTGSGMFGKAREVVLGKDHKLVKNAKRANSMGRFKKTWKGVFVDFYKTKKEIDELTGEVKKLGKG